jgi:hypothetical protein
VEALLQPWLGLPWVLLWLVLSQHMISASLQGLPWHHHHHQIFVSDCLPLQLKLLLWLCSLPPGLGHWATVEAMLSWVLACPSGIKHSVNITNLIRKNVKNVHNGYITVPLVF